MRLNTNLAFAADMSSTASFSTTSKVRVPGWRTAGSPGLFDSSGGAFNPAAGIFTVRVAHQGMCLAVVGPAGNGKLQNPHPLCVPVRRHPGMVFTMPPVTSAWTVLKATTPVSFWTSRGMGALRTATAST